MFLICSIKVFRFVLPFENWEYYAVVEMIAEVAFLMFGVLFAVMDGGA